MYEFWYDYVKQLCFIVYMKAEDIYKDIEEDIEDIDLILQVMNYIDHCLKDKINKQLY